MIRFARLLDALPKDKGALPAYLAAAPPEDAAACQALLSGKRPRRLVALDTLTHWAAEEAAVPDWLLAASLAASGDRAETAALILPQPTGPCPGLADVMRRLHQATPMTAHSVLLDLWRVLPAEGRHIVNRLVSGTFRLTLPKDKPPVTGPTRRIKAVMIMAQPASSQITLALWDRDVPVPVVRVPLRLPETAEIMAWVRDNTQGKYGPMRQVAPVLVFEVEFAGATPNKRRKSGVELHNAHLIGWLRDITPDLADHLDAVEGLATGAEIPSAADI